MKKKVLVSENMPKFRTKYDAHHNQSVEHYDTEYLVDEVGYTPLKTLVERCILMGNNPFSKPADYSAEIEMSEDDFLNLDEDKFDKFDDGQEYQQYAPITPQENSVVNAEPVNNVIASENEVKASE